MRKVIWKKSLFCLMIAMLFILPAAGSSVKSMNVKNLLHISGDGEKWMKTFGGRETDSCLSVEQTSDGGYILAGYTYSYGAGKSDIWLIKTDAYGNEEWNKTFGGEESDDSYAVNATLLVDDHFSGN
ncbi:MAG: hypothetical protein U9O96_06360 [Candidatus Thermoplasmatota archaeon]|nr:hypothetical protein [Candidatus Thermoplasmatota archaeon]